VKVIQSKRDVGFWVAIWVLLIVNLFAIRSWYDAVSGPEVVRRFAMIWIDSPQTWPYNRWLGVQTLQNPNDVWIIQEIIAEVKPDFVIETGTLRGGSAALWAMILEQVNPEGRVISVDIVDKRAKKLPPIAAEKVDFLIGSSTDPGIVAGIAQRVHGKKVVVILDSLHKKHHVLAELRAYAPMVPEASYVIVQDSNVNGHPVWPDFGPGPFEAIEEFLAENDEFQVDKRRERLLFTMHPNGYLRRVRPPREARLPAGSPDASSRD
jgi:cephalosporin hydroxylase